MCQFSGNKLHWRGRRHTDTRHQSLSLYKMSELPPRFAHQGWPIDGMAAQFILMSQIRGKIHKVEQPVELTCWWIQYTLHSKSVRMRHQKASCLKISLSGMWMRLSISLKGGIKKELQLILVNFLQPTECSFHSYQICKTFEHFSSKVF